MTHNIGVSCLVNRIWNNTTLTWDGDKVDGILVGFSTQSDDDNSGTVIPVGIVIMDDSTFQSIPMAFITQKLHL